MNRRRSPFRRQTYSPHEVTSMVGWSRSTTYRKIDDGSIPTLLGPEGLPVKPYRIPIDPFHSAFPGLRKPLQLELALER